MSEKGRDWEGRKKQLFYRFQTWIPSSTSWTNLEPDLSRSETLCGTCSYWYLEFLISLLFPRLSTLPYTIERESEKRMGREKTSFLWAITFNKIMSLAERERVRNELECEKWEKRFQPNFPWTTIPSPQVILSLASLYFHFLPCTFILLIILFFLPFHLVSSLTSSYFSFPRHAQLHSDSTLDTMKRKDKQPSPAHNFIVININRLGFHRLLFPSDTSFHDLRKFHGRQNMQSTLSHLWLVT